MTKTLTARITVTFDVPVRVRVFGVVLLVTADLNLLETPLRQNSVRSAEVASKVLVAETQTGGKRVNLRWHRTLLDIVYDFNDPVVLVITDSRVTVARDFVVQL